MNTWRRLALLVAVTSFIVTASNSVSFVLAQEKPGNSEYAWLNGKWSGPAPAGGELELDLQVINDNQITGQSRVPRGGSKRDPVRTVSGTVEGDKVHLELYSKTGSNQKWTFSHKEETLVAIRKGEEFIFKKLK